MIAETNIVKNWGFSIEELKIDGTTRYIDTKSMVRLYTDSLNGAKLQIRHFGTTNRTGRGLKKMLMANASLTIEETKELAAKLNEIVAAAEEYAATGVPVGF